jgi:Plasmid replication region DNA-binding N-term
MNTRVGSYGTGRERSATVSFAEIESAARNLMAAGDYPSVHAVRLELQRGSTSTIADAMRRFWKDQAALNAGNPVALTRLPPEFADAAVQLWERALRLSLQTAKADDSAARMTLEELKRETDKRARALELREKEWDLAARIRDRALADSREQINILLRQLSDASQDLRARDTRIADLENQVEEYRRQLANVIVRAVSKSRASGLSRVGRLHRTKEKKAPAIKAAAKVSTKRKSVKSRWRSHGKRR